MHLAKNSGTASMRIATVFGIAIRLHVSVLIIFVLIVTSLGQGVLPSWHPEWSGIMRWSAALVAAILFFASLLAHELAHALVARSRGLMTRDITLFLFGGIAAIESEPETPRDEFWIAAAGPAMSLGLAGLFGVFLMWVDSAALTTTPPTTSIDVARLSAAGTIALWVASINLMLALFNLVPGFPMDGGRLFRAALWWRTGDIRLATRKAARVGNMFGWFLMLAGGYFTLTGRVADGLWLLFIGWFIDQLASSSVRQMLIDRGLANRTVATLMRTRFDSVAPDLTLSDFVENYMLRSNQLIWPVLCNDGTANHCGFVSVNELPAEHNPERRNRVTVADCMQPLNSDNSFDPEDNARDAFREVSGMANPVPVVDGQRVVGLLDHRDALRWLAAHSNTADAADIGIRQRQLVAD